jgi:DNA-3-methyladenine glycosylase II
MKINEYNCAVKHFLKNDVLIYELMSKFEPIKLTKRRNYFAALTTSIIGQQLSVSSAKAIITRFNAHFETKLSPEIIINTKLEVLRELGLSNAKAKYIIDLAEKILSKEIDLAGISKKNEQEIAEELTKVKGIGPWTVHMFLIFVLGRPNILPEGDLGIRKAIMVNYNLKNLPISKDVVKISKKNNWSPYNSYAALYLWKSLDGK